MISLVLVRVVFDVLTSSAQNYSTALKTITAELPADGKVAASACAKLTPKLLGQIQDVSRLSCTKLLPNLNNIRPQPNTPPEALVESLSILSILISRFTTLLSGAELKPEPLSVLAPLLSHSRPVVRKRAIVTLSQFIPISEPSLFNDLVFAHVLPYLVPAANIEKQRTTVHLIAAVARHSPIQLAPILDQIIPAILKAVQKDDDELREGALQV